MNPQKASERLFHWTRAPAYWGTKPRIAQVLGNTSGEHILDVGCGTGFFADLATGTYVGVDTSLSRLILARNGSKRPTHAFVAMSGSALGFVEHSFDRALIINIVHHLDDASIHRLFSELHRVVRKQVVVVDGAPDIANPLERFFMRHDRGAHIRQRTDLRKILERYWAVETEQIFHNTLRTVPQVLFTLRPRALPA